MACSSEERVDLVAILADMEVATKPPIGLHVPDGGLDAPSILSSQNVAEYQRIRTNSKRRAHSAHRSHFEHVDRIETQSTSV